MAAALWQAKARDVCARFSPDEGSIPPADLSVREYFDRLCAAERADDAVIFLAHALPRRETIWWGCLCLWETLRPAPPPAADAALATVLGWVRQPSETRKQDVIKAGEAVADTPLGFLASAVSFSGESISLPGLPVVPPPPYLANRLVAGAMQVAASGSGNARTHFGRFLRLGIDVADGKHHWSQP